MRSGPYSLNRCESTEQILRLRQQVEIKIGAEMPEILPILENLRYFLLLLR